MMIHGLVLSIHASSLGQPALHVFLPSTLAKRRIIQILLSSLAESYHLPFHHRSITRGLPSHPTKNSVFAMKWKASNLADQKPSPTRSASLVRDHTPRVPAAFHVLETLVHLIQGVAVGNEFLQYKPPVSV